MCLFVCMYACVHVRVCVFVCLCVCVFVFPCAVAMVCVPQVLSTTAADFSKFAEASRAVAASGRVAVVCSPDAASATGLPFQTIEPLEA